MNLFKKSGIYKIVNLITGLFYIGSAVDLGNRWSSHRKDLRKNQHDNSYLQNAWNKYGADNFEFQVIEFVEDRTKLLEREQYWMDYYKSYERDKGYNLNIKATSGRNKKTVQFCPHGHDTFICGRNKSGACKNCRKKYTRKDPSRDSRIHQFCPKGHDTFKCGRRNGNRICILCDLEQQREARKQRREGTHIIQSKRKICKNGHDTSITGRYKSGSCIVCINDGVLRSRKNKKLVGAA